MEGRRVGMLYRNLKPPAEVAELWIAYPRWPWARGSSRDETLRAML